jgi:hypothetical protein
MIKFLDLQKVNAQYANEFKQAGITKRQQILTN